MARDEEFSSSSDGEGESEVEPEEAKRHQNKEGLLEVLEGLKSDLSWIENLDVTVKLTDVELPSATDVDNKDIGGSVHDDFRRELGFYCQAQAAAKEALSKLRDLGIPTQRPDDYFAEMVKTDTHMQKVRSRLQSVKLIKENAEKKRKMRQMKKFGKKVQQEVLEKRREEKKQMLKEVGRIRKGKRKFDEHAGDDLFNIKTESGKGGSERAPNAKRKKKNEKYGFGGMKRKQKKNTASSAGDPDGFNPSKHGKSSRGHFQKSQSGQKKKKPLKRLGKARRSKQKMRKR